ncbi:MAG: chromosomal replication initiator protein DnaA [Bacteroidales bacterium]|jgi:chromosomal replication initiator protein|nr:chromosomal replication initiator protein DnaA [Bacteroidales bacterium]MDD3331007.1 chromosomal replication initiator protein DnaA [Bacteroidales bacterium]MDD3691631.1 chromosomal replication initiator protein DnaA [Bacteroidales bacterium]MDD4045193.1 chromosomal replication initiator protein DnaA [Bacteroidales bacterium]MDD4582164.1 chromosomal replication initiator protein DnaA [Bacteroidales bacterium]
MDGKVNDCQIIWNQCLKIIKENISAQSYETWFTPIKAIGLSKHVLTIEVPSMFYHEFIEGNFWELLKTAIKKVLGANGKLEYKIPISSSDSGEKSSVTLPTSTINAVESQTKNPIFIEEDQELRQIPNPFVLPGIKKLNIKSQLNKNLNFDNFIEGDCNRLARAAGYAIAKNPGKTAFNPLFIYSSVGLGKTHLAHAIGLETKKNFPELTVLYVNAETFIQQYIEAARGNNINDFVHFYHLLDVLIIDDIEFLVSKPKTQEVFFHIFNFYHQKNKQLVITSDKSPSEMTGFEQRLLSRFKWGLSADLQVPDKETRIKIIRSKLYNNGIQDIDEEVIEYLAYRIVTNVREIEGAIISILAQSSLNKKQITVELAKQMIDKFVQNTAHEMSIDYIQKVVCDYYNMPVNLLFSKSRKRDIVHVRHSSMYFAKKYTDMSLSQIGAKCGDKDHATVLHACRSIENLIATDKKIKEDLNNIDKILKNS